MPRPAHAISRPYKPPIGEIAASPPAAATGSLPGSVEELVGAGDGDRLAEPAVELVEVGRGEDALALVGDDLEAAGFKDRQQSLRAALGPALASPL